LQLEGLGQLKNPMTSLGIEPATFYLQQGASTNYITACPPHRHDKIKILPYHNSSNSKLSNRSVARVLCDNIISSNAWPPRSPDLSQPNFYLQELQKMCMK
jgi:hypothetical protein